MWELLLLTALLALSLNDGVFIGIGKRGPVYLPLDRHIIITGPTRSGKTHLAKRLIKRSGLPALDLDLSMELPLRSPQQVVVQKQCPVGKPITL